MRSIIASDKAAADRTVRSPIRMSMPRDANSPPPFLIGANLPWVHYGIDFGANAWRPEGGIAQPEERAQLELAFAQLAAIRRATTCAGFSSATGARASEFSAGGRPLGLDEFVFRDVDAALDIASRHGIRIMFVLLDFLWCDPVSATRGVQMGGRAHVLADPRSRDALLDLCPAPASRALRRRAADSRVGHHQRAGVDQDDRRRRSADVPGRVRRPDSFEHVPSCHRRLCRCALARSICRHRTGFLSGALVRRAEAPAVAGDVARSARLRSARAAGRISDARIEAERRKTSWRRPEPPGYSGAFYWSVLRRTSVRRSGHRQTGPRTIRSTRLTHLVERLHARRMP